MSETDDIVERIVERLSYVPPGEAQQLMEDVLERLGADKAEIERLRERNEELEKALSLMHELDWR